MGKYKIISVLANHSIVTNGENHAFHYIIETPEGKKIFYGLDGAWFLRPSWEEMKKHKFDIMIFDCTAGDSDDWRLFEHNTIPMLRMMVKEIGERKMLAENGKLIASHFAKSLHGTHEETENILSEINVLTAYDGLKLDF
jgi:phosphoribosyl 1,2-cyclic phosphate phosphodiesterase